MFITSKTESTHEAPLRMDRNNNKEINLAKRIRFKTKHFFCNTIFERPFLTNANTLRFLK